MQALYPAESNHLESVQALKQPGVHFVGSGDCFVVRGDTPAPGIAAVRCTMPLRDLPAPWTGGLLISNTLSSRLPFGPDTDPPGYHQSSFATIRLWRAR